jgi:hypothetical protein
MVELVTNTGDALSRLIQLQAGRHDIRLAWVGDGVTDLTALLNAHAVKASLAKHLWTSVRELLQMPEMNELPEPLRAQITSIVLKAQVLNDLETEARRKRLLEAANSKPQGTA